MKKTSYCRLLDVMKVTGCCLKSNFLNLHQPPQLSVTSVTLESRPVAGRDSIPSRIRTALQSGNLRGKEDVGLGDTKTERNMC
jgi:hypothetical protein